MSAKEKLPKTAGVLAKTPTGINGLDEITGGGLPKGRPTLIAGRAGAGKTLLAMEFLVRGATEFNEPGVFMAFEETKEDLASNVASLGFDLNDLIKQGKLHLDHVQVERSEIEETGEYDLEGLFVRLNYAIDKIGAKRVVLDTIESLFAGLSNQAILRAEIRRLFHWLKDKGVTAIITGERGEAMLTRQGLEEYVSDCVILLDHRVNDQTSTRRLRIVKYRGSTHGTNEYPFLIDQNGISVLPVTSLGLAYKVTTERMSTGVDCLDEMLGGKGFYRGSSIIITGTAGTGKSSIAASVVAAACKRGERCIIYASEESPDQIIRNMKSIGVDLGKWVDKGLLQIHANRSSEYGLEMQLATIYRAIKDFNPTVVAVDPLTSYTAAGTSYEVKSMLTRLVDILKSRGITAIFTSLTDNYQRAESTEVDISALIDTWILLRYLEANGEKTRGLHIIKSRGMVHTNQIREFVMTDKGIKLEEVYEGPDGVLTGTRRIAQQANDKAMAEAEAKTIDRQLKGAEHTRKAVEARVAALWAEFEADQLQADNRSEKLNKK